MALVKCSECGREVSDAAAACPHCGNPRSARQRRGVFPTLLIGAFIVYAAIVIISNLSDDQTARPAAAEGSECAVSDIGLDKLADHTDGDALTITGRILNNCAIPVGVQLKVTLYDKTGAVLAVNDPWPASTNNIPAKTPFAFDVLFLEKTGVTRYDVRVVRVRSWDH